MKNRTLLVLAVAGVLALLAYLLVSRDDAGSTKSESHSPVATAPSAGSGASSTDRGHASFKPASLEGLVLAADGTPVSGATVGLVAAGEDMASLSADVAVLRSDDAGRFGYPSLPPGEYMVSANAPGFLPKQLAVSLAPDQERREFIVQLESGGLLLSGTVRDATGGIVPSAVISALPLANTKTETSASLSNDEGHYSLSLGNGQYTVWAYHADYVPHSQIVEITGGPLTVDFQLAPGAVVEGQVKLLDSGAPEPGAIVSYATERVSAFSLWAGSAGAGETVADDEGRFRITGLHSGTLRLTARGDTTITAEPTHVALGIAEHHSDIELFLDAAYRVTGRVVDAATGEGVAEMTVSLERPGDDGATPAATSADNGVFVFPAVSPGEYRIRARGGEYLMDLFGQPLSVRGDTDAGEVRVHRGAMVRGRVEPAAKALVSVDFRSLADMSPSAIAQAQTDPDGSFEIGPFTPSTFRLKAQTTSGAIGSTEVEVPATGRSDVVIPVAPGASLEGKVVDAAGNPVGNLRVELRQEEEGRSMRVIVNGIDRMANSAHTSPDGSFLIQGLEGGAYQARVIDPQSRPLAWANRTTRRNEPIEIALAPNENRTGQQFVVEAQNAIIQGKVLGPDGQPAADTWVSASLSRADHLRGSMPGPASDPGPPGDHEGEARSEVSVVMIHSDDRGENGSPGLDLSRSGEVPPVLTDAEGNFAITGLRTGKYDLVAEGMKGAARAIVKAAMTGETIEIRMAALTRIEGRVTLAGEPVTGFQVELMGTRHMRKQVRNEEGRFTLYRLDPGPYTLRVRGPRGEAEVDLSVVAGKSTEVEIPLEELVVVTGQVVDESGQPMEGVLTIPTPLRDDGNVSISVGDDVTPTGTDGRFELGVKPGQYLLMVMKIGSGPMATVPFEAKAGSSVDLSTIVAKPGGGGLEEALRTSLSDDEQED